METKDIDISRISVIENIRQIPPREDLLELMESIKRDGLMQPIGVKQVKQGYILIWGYRRLLAFKKLGYKQIPAVVKELNQDDAPFTEIDFLICNASENIHRKNVNIMELGRICEMLQKQNLSVPEIAVRLSIPKSRVENSIIEFHRVPEKHRDKVFLLSAGGQSKENIGKLGSTTATNIVKMRGVSKFDVEKIFDWALKENKTNMEIRRLGLLISQGYSISEAKGMLDNVKIITFKAAANRTLYNKYFKGEKRVGRYLFEAINKAYKDLIFEE